MIQKDLVPGSTLVPGVLGLGGAGGKGKPFRFLRHLASLSIGHVARSEFVCGVIYFNFTTDAELSFPADPC